jgi:hypothetical protein
MEPSFSFKQTPFFDRDNNPKIAVQRPPEKTTGLHNCGNVCERNKKRVKGIDEAEMCR